MYDLSWHYIDDKEKFTAECKHLYHYGCIQKWLEKQRNCPTCRQKIFWCQVWIPFEDFQKTKKRVPFPLERVNQNRLNQVQNVELQQIADHENQQIQLQSNALNFQQNSVHRRNQQDQQNQIQNPLLDYHELNAQIELQIIQGRRNACLMYSLFSILEVFIVISKFYVPKWGVWLIPVQICNVLLLLHIIAAHHEHLVPNFSGPLVTCLFVSAFLYHSVTALLLSGNNLYLASFFPWFAVFFFPVILGFIVPEGYPVQNRNPSRYEYILPGSIWILIEIVIVCGRVFVSNWVNWFGWMQGFHVASLIMFLVAVFFPNRGIKWWNLRGTWGFLAFVGLFTYFSLGALGLSTVNAGHYFLWPLILFFGSWPYAWWWSCLLPSDSQNGWDWEPSRFA